jgi:cell division protein ZapA (FtsZ GTPase activity inhibitor)
MTEQDGKRIRPEDLGASSDQPEAREVKAEGGSFLDKLIGADNFTFDESTLEGEEKAQGVTLDIAHRSGTQKLIFDREKIDTGEKVRLEKFVKLIRENGKEALKGTEFEWFFGEEEDDFLEGLANLLERRIKELNEGSSVSSLRSMGFSEKLVTAMEAFRDMSKRSALKEGISRQVNKVPIIGFVAQTIDGQVVNLRYNPENIDDPSNEVEVIYVNNPQGEKELVFTCKYPNKYKTIKPIVDPSNEKRFAIVDESFTNITDVDAATGQDYSRFELQVKKREGQVDPLFTRIKVIKKPMDMDRELDKYLEEKRRADEKKRLEEERRRQAAAAAYQPPAPSVPSTPQFKWQQQPQTYSRSG